MTTASVLENLEQHNGKKVVLTLVGPQTDDGEPAPTQVEGKVEMGNALGLLFKPKGKAQPELIEKDKILDIVPAPDKPKVLKAKSLKEVAADSVRSHLLERHGVDLDWANGATDEAAATYHDSLDHTQLKLGHVHKAEADSTEREQAIAAAEGEQAGDTAAE